MPTVAGQVTDYDVKGKPRDLSEIIWSISPEDTPFLTLTKRAKATQTLHEWTVDELAPPSDNAQVSGADATDFEGSAVTEKRNLMQILTKNVKVSGTAQAVKEAGVSNQYKYQIAQRMKEIKKDLEFAELSNRVESFGGKTAARRMRGYPAFVTENVSLGNGGAAATASAVATAGTLRALTEDMIRDVLTQCYEAGGNPTVMMSAPKVRSKISSVLRTVRTDLVDENKVSSTVEVYISDYGNIKVVPNRVMTGIPYTQNAVLLIDPQYWATSFLRGFGEKQLAVTGDSVSGQIICEATLEARNPDSSGMIADINPTL